MKSHALPAIALALTTAFLASTAKADTFNFSFSTAQGLHSGAGTLTGNEFSKGEFLITSITGTTDGKTITGLFDVNEFADNDNILSFPADSDGAFFDGGGLSYSVDLGRGDEVDVNFFKGPGAANEGIFNPPGTVNLADDVPVSLSITREDSTPSPVPEPSSICLLGSGVLGAAGMVHRRLSR